MPDGKDAQAFHESPVLRVAVAVFVAWHMLTVAAFALPVTASGAWLQSARSALFPFVSSYGYLLSQWQDWRMFVAPDPFRYTERRAAEILRGPRVIAADFIIGGVQFAAADFCRKAFAKTGDRVRTVRRLYFSRTGASVSDTRLSAPDAASDRSLEWFEWIDAEQACPSASPQ